MAVFRHDKGSPFAVPIKPPKTAQIKGEEERNIMTKIEKLKHYKKHGSADAARLLRCLAEWEEELETLKGFDGFNILTAENLIKDGRYLVQRLKESKSPEMLADAIKMYLAAISEIIEELAENVMAYNMEGCIFDA